MRTWCSAWVVGLPGQWGFPFRCAAAPTYLCPLAVTLGHVLSSDNMHAGRCAAVLALCACASRTTLMHFTVVAQLTLALLPPGPHLFWLCFFAVLGVLVASTIRVATDMGTGIVTGPPARRHPT